MGVKVLAGIAQHGTSEAARVSAVALLFERGWGKAPQPHTGPDGENEITIVIRDIASELSGRVIDAKPVPLAIGSGNGEDEP